MDLHLDLLGVPGGSLRASLERELREAVRSGRLPPGARLPATRVLCGQLGVSRGVVVDAYAQLAAEGYLRTRRGAGTRVATTVARERQPAPVGAPAPPARYDMSPFRPELSAFPRSAWSAALGRVLRSAPDERLGHPDPRGTQELRGSLAAYLGRTRGVRSEPGQIVVTNGLRQGIHLLWSALAADGARRLGIEDPGWRGIRETAAAAGLELVEIPVDGDGLDPERVGREDLDAVALAPAHQYPTGAVLPASRRASLLAWAQSRGAVLVEDDYDAEYRYDRQPIGSMQGLGPEQVVYCGSTSKTLAPAVRLGWLVLPERLVAAMSSGQLLRGAMPAPLEQLALADLIERGELDRHLRRQRLRYGRRRNALLAALSAELPDVRVRGAAAGLYAALHLPAHLEEREVLAAARSRGIALEGLGGTAPGLVVGYANLNDAAIEPAVAALAASVSDADSHRRGDGSSDTGLRGATRQ
jgi:GntR family transcriptional regulator/MocR family aminotransferase